MSEPRHGYVLYKIGGCRCYICAFAVSEYERNRKKQILAGTWQPFTDPTPVRAHVAAHAAAGVGTRRVAELAGVNRKTLQQLMRGRRDRPADKLRREVAERILAVPVAGVTVAPHTPVDATGVRRRIQAMCAMGWGFRAQAQRAGWPRDRWHRLVRETKVLSATTELVARVYDELSMAPPPSGYAADRARAVAEREGWLPPLVWDDDQIDDPDGKPELGLLAEGEDADEGLVWLALRGFLGVGELPPAERVVVERHQRETGRGWLPLDTVVREYLAARADGCDRTAAARRMGIPVTRLHAALKRARQSGDTRIDFGRGDLRSVAA